MDDLGTLLKECRAGSGPAFERLVRCQLDRLYALAARISGDRHAAEDVVQEVFLRVLQGRAPWRGSGPPAAWLARITARAALDFVRARSARIRREEAYAAMKCAERSGRPELPIETAAALEESLASLPPETRAALWLHHAEGLGVRDVARAIGKGKSQAAEVIRKGAAKLRASLSARGLALGVPPAALLLRLEAPAAPAGFRERIEGLKPGPGVWGGGPAGIGASMAAGLAGSKKMTAFLSAALVIAVASGTLIVLRNPPGRPGAGGEGSMLSERPIPNAEPALRLAAGQAGPAAAEGLGAASAGIEAAPAAPAAEPPADTGEHAIRGKVLDRQGNPLARAKVYIRDPGRGLSPPREIPFAVTDEDGSFILEGFPPGTHQLVAARYDREEESRIVTLPGNEEIVFRLRPTGLYVRGRAFLRDREHPLRDAVLIYGDGVRGGSTPPLPSFFVVTDGEGIFFVGPFINLGEHLLTFQHGNFQASSHRVGVWSGPVPDVEVVLIEGVTARGVVRNRQGEPIPLVRMVWGKENTDLSTHLESWTDENGRYRREGLEPGVIYHVAVQGACEKWRRRQDVVLSGAPEEEVAIEVDCLASFEVRVVDPEGNPVPGLSVGYSYRFPGMGTSTITLPTDEAGSTFIRLVQEGLELTELTLRTKDGPAEWNNSAKCIASRKDQPFVFQLEKAFRPQTVEVVGVVIDGAEFASSRVLVRARDGEGRLRFPVPGEPPGRFRIFLEPGRYRLETQAGRRGVAAAEVEVSLTRAPEPIRLQLSTDGAILVHVDGVGDEPGETYASVEVAGPGGRLKASTDEEGWVAFAPGPGAYTVTAATGSGARWAEPVTGVRPGDPPVEISLELRCVKGTVLLDGRPAPEARIWAWPGFGGDPYSSRVRSDAEGRFTLAVPRGDRICVIAQGPGFAQARSEMLEVPPRGQLEGTFVVALPGIDFQAMAVDSAGMPVPDANVELFMDGEPPFSALAKSDASGVIRLPRLPPGRYVVPVESIDQETSSRKEIDWSGTEDPPSFILRGAPRRP